MPHQEIKVPSAPSPSPSGILKLQGSKIVGADGKPVLLRGAGLGGHLNMENFITGYPGHENDMRKAVKKVLGQEKYDFFFDKFLEYFFTEKDAEFFASLGLNCIRIPFNYRHFEDDMNPGVYHERGFQWLDRIINICGNYGIYTILDLHAVPGGQNIDWHCDTGIHRALFWEHIEFQNRAIALWEKLAERYRGNTWVAGYNPLNEPTDEEHTRVLDWYARAEKAIHSVDPDHILFWDGNTFAADLSHFGDPLPGSVYSIHDYSIYGFPQISEPYEGTPEQKSKLENSFKRKIGYHEKIGGHIWNGEFGPVYASPDDGSEWEKINERRYHVLKDQLELYDIYHISWSIWLYKDIGFQGMVYTSPDSPYISRLAQFLAKKKRLAADAWGADTSAVQPIFDPIQKWISEEAPHVAERYPPTWKVNKHVGRLIRNILLSEELTPEYAAYFEGLSTDELDEMAASFKFENCVQREGLNKLPFRVEYISYPDIEPTFKKLGIPQGSPMGRYKYTVPAIADPSAEPGGKPTYVADSWTIALYLECAYPPPLYPAIFPHHSIALQHAMMIQLDRTVEEHICNVAVPLVGLGRILDDKGHEHFIKTREAIYGKSLAEVLKKGDGVWMTDVRNSWSTLAETLDMNGPMEDVGLYVMGKNMSYSDFYIAGLILWLRRGEGIDGQSCKELFIWDGGRWALLWNEIEKLEAKSTEV